MRLSALIAMLGLGAMLFILAGCSGNETTSTSRFNGTLVSAAGENFQGATVSFFRNGVLIRQVPVNANGTFSTVGLPSGTYTIAVTRTINGTPVTTVIPGTFTVPQSGVRNFAIIPSSAISSAGVLPAGATTGTLVVFTTDQNGTVLVPAQASVQIDTFTPVTGTTPVVIRDIATGNRTVKIIVNGVTRTFTNVGFTAGTVTAIAVPVTTTPGAFTISGNITTTAGTNVSGANVLLFQNGQLVGQGTTGTTGNFTINNVSPGTFTVVLSRSTNFNGTTVETRQVVGTSTVVNSNLTGQNFQVVQEENITPLFPTTPSTTSASLVVFATDQNGQAIPVSVQVGTNTPVEGTSPLVLLGIANTTPQTVTVSAGTGNVQTFTNVPFTPGVVTVLNTRFTTTTPTTFTISGTVVSGTSTTTPITSANVALLRNGAALTSMAVNAQGQFSFTGAAAGTYTLEISSPSSAFLVTEFGPITLSTANATGLIVPVFNIAQLQASPFNVTAPPSGQANVVAFGLNPSGTFAPVSVQVDTQTPSAVGNPAFVTTTPGTHTITVTAGTTSKPFTNVVVPASGVVIIDPS